MFHGFSRNQQLPNAIHFLVEEVEHRVGKLERTGINEGVWGGVGRGVGMCWGGGMGTLLNATTAKYFVDCFPKKFAQFEWKQSGRTRTHALKKTKMMHLTTR